MLLQSPHLSDGETQPFELKGSLFTLTVMHLFNMDPGAIEQHLTEKVKRAPGFFNNTPVVIDLGNLSTSGAEADFRHLAEILRKHSMIPVGIRNGAESLQAAAQQAGLPILPDSRVGGGSSGSSGHEKRLERPDPAPVRSKVIDHVIRSGQQIYAPDGDLTILGTVSAGAEAIADGSIHIYGALRGRALAGIKGNVEAQIFCHSLEAELISIAGRYWVSEQIDPSDHGKPSRIRLQADRLIIGRLQG